MIRKMKKPQTKTAAIKQNRELRLMVEFLESVVMHEAPHTAIEKIAQECYEGKHPASEFFAACRFMSKFEQEIMKALSKRENWAMKESAKDIYKKVFGDRNKFWSCWATSVDIDLRKTEEGEQK